MKLPKLSIPGLKLFAPVTPALVVRSQEVEVLAMKGKKVTGRVRVPIEAKGDAGLTAAIEKALQAASVKHKQLAVSMPTQDVLFRFFTLPAIPKSERDAAVQYEARKYIPFKTEELVWDSKVVPGRTADTLDVIFAGIQGTIFDRFQAALAAAGVEAVRLETRSLSLARLIKLPEGTNPNEFVCLVDVDDHAGHLAIVKDRLPYLTRDINLAPRALPATTETPVQPQPGAPVSGGQPEAAERRHESVADTIDYRAQRLLSEVSVSIDFFMREHPGCTVQQVFLFGEEGVVGPWCRWLTEQLRCTVELGSRFLDQQAVGEVPLSFASAVGLLLGAKDYTGKTSLDFLKRTSSQADESPQDEKTALLMAQLSGWLKTLATPQSIAILSVSVIVFLGLWFKDTQALAVAHRHLNQLTSTKSDLNPALRAMTPANLSDLKTKAEAQVAALKQVIDGRVSVAAKLDAIARSLPEGLWITGLTYEEKLSSMDQGQLTLVMTGACFLGEASRELSAIQKFEEQIRGSTNFIQGFDATRVGQIKAQDSPKQQYTYQTFQLTSDNATRSSDRLAGGGYAVSRR